MKGSLTNRISVTIERKKRKDGYTYSLRWFDPFTMKRCSEYVGRDKHEAMLRRTERIRELSTGTFKPEVKYSFDAFWKDFKEAQEGRLKATTFKHYNRIFKLMVKRFSHRKYMQDITPLDVQKFISSRMQEVSPVSVNTEIRHMKSLYNYAVEWERVSANPFRKVKRLKEPPLEINVITPEQEARIMRSIDKANYFGVKGEAELKLRYKALIKIAIQGGLRRSEIYFLRWKDIDLVSGKISLVCRPEWSTKNGKNRTVFVREDTLHLLRCLKMCAGGIDPEKPFYYATPDALCTIIKRVSRRAWIKFSLHDCRRTCASRMAEQGIPIQVCKEFLGHADIQTTMKYYTRISEGALREAMLKANAPQADYENRRLSNSG
ncbi:tyrosine-type recombinase/integrase [Planctomycetota bacterium]